jgi:integrase/recombinase XerC
MKLERTALTDSDVRKLISVTGRGKAAARNRALLDLLFHSGLRISEALALTRADIEGDRIRVRHGKGNKQRTVTLTLTYGHWEPWLEQCPTSGPIFTTGKGEAISRDYVRGLLARLKKKAGLTGRVHAHAFRHGHACAAFKVTNDLAVVSRQLGHESIATTSIYLQQFAADMGKLSGVSLA